MRDDIEGKIDAIKGDIGARAAPMSDWHSPLPLDLRFVPWPKNTAWRWEGPLCYVAPGTPAASSGRSVHAHQGFVSNSRFQRGNEPVIPRTGSRQKKSNHEALTRAINR